MVSPSARGLFDKAIVQSAGCVGRDAVMSLKDARANGLATAKAAGCVTADTADACLRGKSTAGLLAASESGHEGYRPVVDGTVLPASPARAFAAGTFHRVPVLHGSTHDEESGRIGSEETVTGRSLTWDEYVEKLVETFGRRDARRVLAEYPVGTHGSPGGALTAVMTDAQWSTDAFDTQRALARHVPVYAYDFAEKQSPYFRGFPRPSFPLGTGHMIDLAYLFENELFEPLNTTQAGLSDSVISYWSGFARTGEPRAAGLARWERFTPYGRYVQGLASGSGGIGRTDFAAEHHYKFWTSLRG